MPASFTADPSRRGVSAIAKERGLETKNQAPWSCRSSRWPASADLGNDDKGLPRAHQHRAERASSQSRQAPLAPCHGPPRQSKRLALRRDHSLENTQHFFFLLHTRPPPRSFTIAEFATYSRIQAAVSRGGITAEMDAPEPDTPFAAVTAQTSKYGRVRFSSAAH